MPPIYCVRTLTFEILQMRRRQFIALILASALITLDGTAATIALPAAVLLQREAGARAVIRDERVSGVATASLVVLLGALAYALMRAARHGMNDPILLVPARSP
jgi:hypothetical protein